MSWLRHLWDSERLRRFWLAVLVVWLIVAPFVIVLQAYDIQHFTTNAHAETVSLLTEHTNTLNEVAHLQKEFDTAIAKAQPALSAGQDALLAQISWIECYVTQPTAGACGAPPALPK